MFDKWRGFKNPELSEEWHNKLTAMGTTSRGNIIKMTSLASSGHPGGSMSSMDIYLTLYNMANVDPNEPGRDDRDRIIISHGHTSPGAYMGLAEAGFFSADTAIAGFRQAGSPFEGHVEQSVPGIEWDSGNLGQGLAVGVGKAFYGQLSKQNFHTFVFMGDGEQQKGQISESRRIAAKFKLKRVTAIIDYNRLQISGNINDVMPQNVAGEWSADGWNVVTIDGHDLKAIYSAFHNSVHKSDRPTCIIANTVMGKGVSFMENKHGYHGAPVKPDMLDQAFKELSVPNNMEALKALRAKGAPSSYDIQKTTFPKVDPGQPLLIGADDITDNRSAFGNALVSVADANMNRDDFNMAVFDCDLAGSVKTNGFEKKYPESFFQLGIAEHSTAVAAGALSVENAISVWADFGAFGIVETYNQARLNDINHTNMKLFCTHCGINVGEDGKTHQCIDYFGLLNSTFGWKVITPADPNQTDHIVRHVLTTPGNFAVVMGRAKIPTITDENGQPFFGENYKYNYGHMDVIRKGHKVGLVCSGNMLNEGIKAWEMLKEQGIEITLVNISDWSDLDINEVKMCASNDHLFVLEDHNIKTGLGTAIGSAIAESGLSTNLVKIGVTGYASSGKPADLYKMLGMDAESVALRIAKVANRTLENKTS